MIVCLFVFRSSCLSVCHTIYQSVCRSRYLSRLLLQLSVCLSVALICRSVSLFVFFVYAVWCHKIESKQLTKCQYMLITCCAGQDKSTDLHERIYLFKICHWTKTKCSYLKCIHSFLSTCILLCTFVHVYFFCLQSVDQHSSKFFIVLADLYT